MTAQNACKECISKDAKCSLSDHGGSTLNKLHGSRRALLPSQQSSSVLPELYKGPLDPSSSVYDAPHPELYDEFVTLYFDLIHDKQHLLFHPPTFLAQHHAGKAPDFLVWGMAALVSR